MAKLGNQKFFSIDPGKLVKDRTLTFDVYVRLELNQRAIVFRSRGTALDDLETISRMRHRGLKYFYVLESDRKAYEEYLKGPQTAPAPRAPGPDVEPALMKTAFSEPEEPVDPLAALDPATKDPAAKAEQKDEPVLDENPIARARRKADEKARDDEQRAKAAAETAAKNEPEAEAVSPPEPGQEFTPPAPAEQLMAGLLKPAPENIKAREEAKDMVKNILKGAGKTVTEIVENPDTEHATNVAIYTTLFAMGLKKNEQLLLQDLIIASLMHDIGMTQLPPSVLGVPRTKQTAAQKAQFEAHVPLAFPLLADLDYKPNPRVLQLLGQHHEKFNGTGYPAHLESFRIDELAQLIAIADLLDTIACGNYDGAKRSLGESIHVVAQIERTTTFPEYFNPDTFRKVMNWLKKGGGVDYLAAAEQAVAETRKRLLKTA